MNNWFYASTDGQRGPVDDEMFRQLIASGEIGPETLVWHSGMPEWQPLRAVAPELCAQPPALSEGPDEISGANASFGELKRHAREGLRGNLGTFICAGVLLFLIAIGAQIVPIVGGLLASMLLTPIMEYGMANLSLRAAQHRTLEISDGFVGFQRQFGRALAVYWLRGLYLFLWGLPAVLGTMTLFALEGTTDIENADPIVFLVGLLVIALLSIPAYIKTLSYSMAVFLMIDRPTMTAGEAITESRNIMLGNKMRFFLFSLSFFGWWLLVPVTFGLALLWVAPYMSVSKAVFYRSIRR